MIFHYSLLNSLLIGSESPLFYPRPEAIVQDFQEKYSIQTVFILEERDADIFPVKMDKRHRPISSKYPPSVDVIKDIVDEIMPLIKNGNAVWAYCSQGCDRTGSLLSSCLALATGDAEEAIKKVYSCLPHARQTEKMKKLWEPYANIIRSIYSNPSI